MTTNTTRIAINATKEALREATRTAILEGDLDDATTLLGMLKGFEVSFVDNNALTPREEELVRGGLKIEAIKMIRGRLVGLGLKEAKDIVEAQMDRLGVIYTPQ